ncbi:MAG: CopG family antitoxin [Elusimicrobiota bacterium]|jgi:predicted DNA binding CopG/RHH family protein
MNKKDAKRLPSFKSLKEESRYWDKHSLTDHLDVFTPVKTRLRGPVKHLLSIRIDLDLMREIRRIADYRGVPYQTLMQQWLQERAEQESPSIDPGSVYASGFAFGIGSRP